MKERYRFPNGSPKTFDELKPFEQVIALMAKYPPPDEWFEAARRDIERHKHQREEMREAIRRKHDPIHSR